MAEKFSLKDHLFNARTLGQLADEYAASLPGFGRDAFLAEVLPGLEGRELKERLDWIADCVEKRLPQDFPAMADALEAAMPPELDPALSDDDFGQFIHAVPGILAVRHGLEEHRERAMALLHAATRRFSMEFYIRPFLDRWPRETLDDLDVWCGDPNYHVRRLVSEGTRPRLPWAPSISLDPLVPLRFLDRLFADPTRYVTRSVANHLNDIARLEPDLAVDRVRNWQTSGRQDATEMNWIAKHALRGLIKAGDPGAIRALGYDPKLKVNCDIWVQTETVRIGQTLDFKVSLEAAEDAPVIVDYVIQFHRPGRSGVKVFKLRTTRLVAGKALVIGKSHRMKGDATTFRLYPGHHAITVMVNGVMRAEGRFELVA